MALTQGDTAPYAPPATVTDILRRYRDRGLPAPIDAEVLERAGVSATLSQRTLQTLKLLGFIDAEGQPTPEFEEASRAPEDEYKQRLGEVLLETYREVIQFADPAQDSYGRIRDAFRGFNPKGQQERMVTLFLGLLEFAGLDTSAATATRRRTEKARPASGRGKGAQDNGQPPARPGRGSGSRPSGRDPRDGALVAWFDTRPDPGSPWAKTDRDTFIITLRAMIDGIYPHPEEDATED